MNNTEIKISDLRNYALNINAISDISFFENKFNDINMIKLDFDQINSLSDSLMFMIEQVTRVKNQENNLKVKIIREIIENYIFNNLETAYYSYYLAIRESMHLERSHLESIFTEMLNDDISFLNEFQKVSFISFLTLLEDKVENKELIAMVIEKLKKVNVDKNDYPEFAPSKVKVLEEKTEINKLDIQDIAEMTAYALEDISTTAELVSYSLEDSSMTAEMLAYALEKIEELEQKIKVLEEGVV